MAQAWESDAIKEAGERWAKAKAEGNVDAMNKAAEDAKRLRAEAGYELNGGSTSVNDVKVKDQNKWKSSGTQKTYEAEAHGIGTPKSISKEQYNELYGPGGTLVDDLDQKVKDDAAARAKKNSSTTTTTAKPVTPTVTQPATPQTTQKTEQVQQTAASQPTTQQSANVPAGVVIRTIYPAAGGTAQGYIKNGVTYYLDGTPLKNGDSVIDDNGVKWVKGDAKQNAQAKAVVDALRGVTSQESVAPVAPVTLQPSGLPTTYEELNELIMNSSQKAADETKEYYEKLLEQNQAQIDYTTQAAIREQQALAEQADADAYNQQKDAYIRTLKNRDNLAYQSAARGDAGGIGMKLYSDEQNSYDNQVYQINLELQNLKNEVSQTVADLEAQGQFEMANAAAEIGMKRIEALQSQRDNLLSHQINLTQDYMQYQDQQKDIAFDRALQRLQLGAFSAEDAMALGISEADAERIAQQYNVLAQIDLAEAQRQLAAVQAQSTTSGGIKNDTPKKVEGDAGDDGDKNPISPVSPIDPNGGTPDNTSAAKSAALRDSLLNELRNAGTLNEEDLLNRIQRAQAAGMSDDDAYALIATLLGNKVADSIYSNYWTQTK